MARKFRVLSVDWDYFIDATASIRAEYFPDGGVFVPYLENVIWSQHYSYGHGSTVRKIGVKQDEYRALGVFLRRLRKNPKFKHHVYLANNHQDCYNYIKEEVKKGGYTDISITNIDFHHDLYDEALPNLNSGNWLAKLIVEDKAKCKWVRQRDSYKGSTSLKVPDRNYPMDKALSAEYDMIFLCKSGLWSPPHLDKYFVKLCEIVIAGGDFAIGDPGALVDRWSTIKTMAAEYDKQMAEMNKRLRNSGV